MSDPSNPYLTPPATAYSGARVAPHSSRRSRHRQEDSDESQRPFVNKTDPYRVGGPTLPEWPIAEEWHEMETLSSSSPTYKMFWHVQQQIEKRLLPFMRMQLVYRHHKFDEKQEHDVTVLVYGHLTYVTRGNTYEDWANLITDCLEFGNVVGFAGRVEVLDRTAINGMFTFPAQFSTDLVDVFRSSNYQDLLIEELDSLGEEVPWSVVMPANRGYSFETSHPSVVVKVDHGSEPCPFALIRLRFDDALQRLEARLSTQSEDDLCLLDQIKVCLVRTDALWGLFSTDSSVHLHPHDKSWTLPHQPYTLGKSIARSGTNNEGTIGGYVRVLDKTRQQSHMLGMTCYHIVKADENGNFDENLEENGFAIDYPCEAPPRRDREWIKAAEEGDVKIWNEALERKDYSDGGQEFRANIEQSQRVIDFADHAQHFGNAVVASSYRNVTWGSAELLLDWALVLVDDQHVSRCVNTIAHFQTELRSHPLRPDWHPRTMAVKNVVGFPRENPRMTVFKQGRTTGVTAATLSHLLPASFRISGVPVGLHHRGFVAISQWRELTFAKNGDSGSWILDGDGSLLGLLFAGDYADGSAIFTPIQQVYEDMLEILGKRGFDNISLEL